MKKFLIAFPFIIFILYGCETGVDDSPDAGTLRVVLQSDPSDTILIERSDTFSVYTRWNAEFVIKIFQGRVYQDSNFAVLFRTPLTYRQEDWFYNIIQLDSSTRTFEKFTIFESYIPPGSYNKIEFGVNSEYINITATNGKTFFNTVELPPGEKLLVPFPVDFNISEGKTTQINVQLSPFRSVQRYRDIYRFYRQMSITGVQYF